ncbi:MAG: hypothetical protein PVI23_07265 [Maricaulaceae bacterium]|jgi:hypothetical protein
MPIEHSLSDPDRILEVRFIGDVSGDEYAHYYVKLTRDHPGAMFYHEIIDLLRYTGDVGNEPVNQLSAGASEYEGAPPDLITILVTHDTQFDSFAAVLQAKFPYRTYKIARSMNEAYRMLAQTR